MTANVLLDNLPKGVTGVLAAVLFKSKEDILNSSTPSIGSRPPRVHPARLVK
jgi:hypothetical protein